MYIMMFIIAFCLMADASILILNPSIYRKSLNFINETLCTAWSILYGLLFTFCAIFVFITVIFSDVSVFYILAAILLSAIGLFFLLCGSEKYENLAVLWASFSNWQYRLAGLIFIILTAIVCYITVMVGYNG